jgi:hypothetical protein
VSEPRTLTPRHRNRALLARQLLLARVRAPLPRVVERMGGIQAQYAPSAYVGLWSRVEDFRRDTLTRALGRKTLVQGTSLRSTIHIMSRADYWPFVVAVQASQQTWWLRVTKGPDGGRWRLGGDALLVLDQGETDEALDPETGRTPTPG